MAEDTFIIRIWCEYSDHEGVKPEYRGYIEHVPSGERCYLPHFQAIFEFINPYVQQLAVPGLPNGRESGSGRMWQVRQWMQRRLLNG